MTVSLVYLFFVIFVTCYNKLTNTQNTFFFHICSKSNCQLYIWIWLLLGFLLWKTTRMSCGSLQTDQCMCRMSHEHVCACVCLSVSDFIDLDSLSNMLSSFMASYSFCSSVIPSMGLGCSSSTTPVIGLILETKEREMSKEQKTTSSWCAQLKHTYSSH